MGTDQESTPKIGSVVRYNGKTYKVMAYSADRTQVDIRPHPSGGIEIRVPVTFVESSP